MKKDKLKDADVVYRCPWCGEGYILIKGEQPQGCTILYEKCTKPKCGKPYQIIFPGGEIRKSRPIPNKNGIA